MSQDEWVNDRMPHQVDPGIDVGVDDAEFEQPYEANVSRDPHLGDAETLLKRAVDIIVTAPTMPLSSSPRVDRDEMVELLSEALSRLPEELRQARHLLRERDEFIARTRREAAEVVEAAACSQNGWCSEPKLFAPPKLELVTSWRRHHRNLVD